MIDALQQKGVIALSDRTKKEDLSMKRTLATAVALAFLGSSAALADEKVSDADAAKIKEIVAAWGCEGGSYEQEAEGTGVYEAEDVKCKGGQYDFRLTKDMKVFSITMD
jgi:hypothetical protein